MADSTGKELTYGRALVGSLLLSRLIRRHCAEESVVGVMLPASVAGALANIALLIAGKIPVNLNFTAGREALASAVRQCGIRKILTSRAFLAKAKIDPIEGTLFLEDMIRETNSLRKAVTVLLAFLLPPRLLQSFYCNPKREPDALAAIIFSSGTTTTPKGVMLSHHNILSNIEGLTQLFRLSRRDRMMAALPFFHALGFTCNLWFPLLSGIGVAYHSNPKDAGAIGAMVLKYQATILISAPSFYALYTQGCSRREFASLRYAIAGGEKLREPIAKGFREKFGRALLEGYGCTEMGPVVSVNVPGGGQCSGRGIGCKPGTVGRPLPGVVVEVVDPGSWKPVPCGKEGLLLVNGPSRMLGYVGVPQKSQKVIRDGWYVTGDIASVDEDGFIRITDRASRFSKIGGEMVPHIKVEETIRAILDEGDCVVTGVVDKHKGERLVAFYTADEISVAHLWERLCEASLPKLWIPRREDLYPIDALPTLATGKPDLTRLKSLALERQSHTQHEHIHRQADSARCAA